MSTPARTPEPRPARRPIPAVRMSTVALIGVVAAVSIPAGATALVLTGGLNSRHETVQIRQPGPISKVVVATSNGSVNVTGDTTMSGVSGQASLNWNGSVAPPRLDQTIENGVLTLRQVCLKDQCGGTSVTIRVPPNIAVQATTSNAGIDVSSVNGGVDLQTSNAGVDAKDLGDGDATIRTSNGGVDATFSGGPKQISITSSNGSIDVRTDGKTTYYDDVYTTNDSQTLDNKRDRHSENTLYAHTSNGSVHIR